MTTPDAATAAFEQHRRHLLGIAYRIVGQWADAEDVVQDAYLRWAREERADVRDPRAFLVTLTSRIALDRLRRIAARRESYVGDWLPEPVQVARDLADGLEAGESLSYALLLVLETLSPLERVVYVLREVFGYSHADVATMLERSEPAVRQLARRARAHVATGQERFAADTETADEAARRFVAASATGDLAPLLALLAPDVELVADSGGRVRAPLLPVRGAGAVARFLAAVHGRARASDLAEVTSLSGSPAVVVLTAGVPAAAVLFGGTQGHVDRIYLVANPSKLGHVTSG